MAQDIPDANMPAQDYSPEQDEDNYVGEATGVQENRDEQRTPQVDDEEIKEEVV